MKERIKIIYSGEKPLELKSFLTQKGYLPELSTASQFLSESNDQTLSKIVIYCDEMLCEDEKLNRIVEEFKQKIIILVKRYDLETILKCYQSGIFRITTFPLDRNHLSYLLKKPVDSESNNNPQENVIMRLYHNGQPLNINMTSREFYEFININFKEIKVKNDIIKSFIENEESDKEILFKNLLTVENSENRKIVEEIYRALEENQFIMFYQPVIDLESEAFSGFESLIRWNHPEKGLVSPDQFIKIAESSDVIIPLSEWVIKSVCSKLDDWQKKFKINNLPFKVNVNLSAKQFLLDDLSDIIIGISEMFNVNPKNLGFEITESSFMQNMDMANMTLLKLRSKKFTIYLDDFGTGYSSLSYLQHFPVDFIKIDQSFVKWMHVDDDSEHIIKSIIGLAHGLRLKVVAEGVEILDHVSALKALGVEYVQGFYYSKPMTESEAEEYLEKYCKIN